MSGWFEDTRMEWIKETLYIFGYISRANLERKFRISTPQASHDIQQFLKDYPGSMTYDLKKKVYVASYVAQQKNMNLPAGVKRRIP